MTVTGRLREDRRPATATASVHGIGGGASLVDVHFQGSATIIGVGVLELPEGGIALLDPGPEARLHALRAGLAELGHTLDDVRAIFLTHIHLDHATAAGAIVREAPHAIVHVHAVGAPHMADPSRLLASAGRIYGDAMATLWGDFLPVPQASLRVVDEGDVVALGGRRFEVAYVPGHASTMSPTTKPRGDGVVGDVRGIRIVAGPRSRDPPPDIRCENGGPALKGDGPERTIVTTHVGPYRDSTPLRE